VASDPPSLPDHVWWQCQRCGNCCRWPGEVRLTEEEIPDIARFVGMSEEAFIQRHTRVTRDRRALSLHERPDGSCPWLDGIDCRLQPVKPKQCRGFPNEWDFPGWQEVCEAIPLPIEEKPQD